MSDQKLALIQLQKRMLDADMPRRLIAIVAAGATSLLFLTPLQVALFLGIYALTDAALTVSLNRLVAAPSDPWRMRLVQLTAFAAMSAYLMPAAMLWPLPGATPKIGAVLQVFGGMLSIILVRTVLTPMVIANSLPLGLFIFVIAVIERNQISPPEQMFLGFALIILGLYFALTLIAAQRINRERALEHHAALTRVETQRRFLTTMSHELRTPLNGLLGMSQSLIARYPGQGAEVIRDSARDMAAMVDDLLDNAAIEAGALRINLRPVELASVMVRVKDRWDGPFAAKGLRLTLSAAADLPKTAMIDPLRLFQCLSNLLANAWRLTQEGGVDLTLRRHPNGLEAVITDTGPGLPIGAEAQLFQPFTSLRPTGQDTGPSNGLGLSITLGLARAMGGDLKFERPLAGGSRFRLTIAAQETFELPAADAPTELRADLLGKRILLVDDIATNRLVLKLLLAGAGAVPIETSSGEQALALLADPSSPLPDAALLDIRMPGLSGFDTLGNMRALGAGFPIIAVSADAAPEERAEALAHGFDGYLTKPIEDAQLRSLLAQVLARAGHL